MERSIFTGIRPLYSSKKGSPHEIEIRILMRDLIERKLEVVKQEIS